MGNVWGKKLKLSIFGESHGNAIGIIIDGLPAGFKINFDDIYYQMKRRSPGRNEFSTARKEKDQFEILSGYFMDKTTGSPLCAIIKNENTKSNDYNEFIMRPGHADLVAYYKYNGHSDYRGGGHFSGRLTAPLTFAGAIAKQILQKENILIGARIKQISNIFDSDMKIENIIDVSKKEFPVFDDVAGEKMKQKIIEAKQAKDSVGGVIECAALSIPCGIGDPFFDSLESSISSMMFSIPAIKAIEFGDGCGFSLLHGSEANDQLCFENDKVKFLSNHNGGINGGISNGQPLVFRVTVKPTPSIGAEQTTVDLSKNETIKLNIVGRHDPCIVQRAVPVIEAGLAICILNFIL
jgi:chorismate synthase